MWGWGWVYIYVSVVFGCVCDPWGPNKNAPSHRSHRTLYQQEEEEDGWLPGGEMDGDAQEDGGEYGYDYNAAAEEEEGEEGQGGQRSAEEQRLLDELYALDYEDMVGDLPCRFKYRQVRAQDGTFGAGCSFGIEVGVAKGHTPRAPPCVLRQTNENKP